MLTDRRDWRLALIEAPEFRLVTLAEAKAWARIDGSDWDDQISGLIVAATGHYEQAVGRVMETSSWELRGPCWPACGISIPACPIRTVTEVAYIDEDLVERSLGAGEWRWHRTGWGARVLWTSEFTSPQLYSPGEAVIVRCSAGYSDPADSGSGSGGDPELTADEQDRTAIRQLVAHWHRQAEPAVLGTTTASVPDHYRSIVERRRVYR